jgi:hypothetical protein
MGKRLTALLVFGVLAWGSPAFALGWPDAIQALAKEKSKAAACVALLKSAGDKKAITEGQLVYIDAKAMSDGVIAGLKTLVVQRGKPSDLPKLAESLDTSAAALQKVCDAARSAAEAAAGAKGPVGDIVKEAIGPIVDLVKSSVSAIYSDWKDMQKIEQTELREELQNAVWPNF